MSTTPRSPSTYRLAAPAVVSVSPPVLDDFQQAVVDHPGGPLLVLAGPGTGKTTTLVEAIVDRIDHRGATPDAVLALTFSRKAAEQLRDRVTARLGRTTATSMSSTFHSFAYGIVRRYSPADLYAAPLRLLSAPEQDVVLQELLTDAEESVTWPPSVARAVGTRGFAREVQAVLARAREKGLDPDELTLLGVSEGKPEFVAAGAFLGQYLDVLGSQSAIDYADLIARAVVLARVPEHQADLRARFAHVFVDEYQDTDPAQVSLLQAIAGDGRNLTAVGDPDQSIYGFRGAEVRGILDFPEEFARTDRTRADVIALRVTRRFGPRLLRASRRVVSGVGFSGAIPTVAFEAFRDPQPPAEADRTHGDGRVEVLTFDTERAEAEHLADLLRRAHLEDGVPWSEMAVLVRSGRTSIPALRRALGRLDVPVEVASDETPLVQEPAVQPLLDALRAVVNLDNDDPATTDHIDVERARELLESPLAGLDATDLRFFSRSLRHHQTQQTGGGPPRSSPELLRAALLEPAFLDPARFERAGLDASSGRAVDRVRGLAALLATARAELDGGATAEEVLWTLWSGTDWPARLRRAVDLGGSGARFAHRDLDAICALFDVAARAEEQRGHTSVANFRATLVAQRIPADTLADRGVRGGADGAVRLLTAHRAKGLEWRLVVVAHVQEEGWPDLRRRSTLLQADRIGTGGLLPALSIRALLAEERRLFYVACTRARERLVVTAVASPDDDGEQPSRFVHDLGPRPTEVQGRPRKPLSLAGVVADLRRTSSDPAASPGLRGAATRRLAHLSLAGERGRALVPQADPATWWGLRARSVNEQALRPVNRPLTLSASALESLLTCPVKWFLEREAGGERASSQSQGFGKVVHALADRVAKGEIPGDPAAIDALMTYVDEVWGRLVFRTPWARPKERAEVEVALTRFLAWHCAPGARTILATEQRLSAEVELPDGQRVVLNGYADRLELDEAGEVVVVDLKTSKEPPSQRTLETNPQLGLYQHAVNHGAADELAGRPARSGGAELVQLRKATRSVKVQPQPPQLPNAQGHLEVEEQLMRVAAIVRSEQLQATPGDHCKHCDFHAVCPTKVSGTVLS